MTCQSPMSIARPNGGGASDRVTVPCGKCLGCLSKKRREWSFRLEQEFKVALSAFFITLTYDDEHLNFSKQMHPEVSKRDVQLFIKRLRVFIDSYKKRLETEDFWPKFKYYITSEYGPETFRPHYHGIFFNIPFDNVPDIPLFIQSVIAETWQKGIVDVGNVTSASINYVTKYCITHKDDLPDRAQTFSLMSTKPAIGSDYIKSMGTWHIETGNDFAVISDGVKTSLPRYYKDKIFSKTDKEENSLRRSILNNLRKNLDEKKMIDRFVNPFEYEHLQTLQNNKILKKRLTKNSKL